MFNKKIISLYKQLFDSINVIQLSFRARIGDEVYIRVGNKKVKAKCLSSIEAGKECVVFKDNQNKYFLLCDTANYSENSIAKSLIYRRTIQRPNHVKYLVKTVSYNLQTNQIWLGGYKKDAKIINGSDITINNRSSAFISNLGKGNRYNLNIQSRNSQPNSYINKLNGVKINFNSTDLSYNEVYLGNGLWESVNWNERLTIIDNQIFPNTVIYTSNESPNGDECRRPRRGLDQNILVPTWTPENPSNLFNIEIKNCGLTYEEDPTLEERNPQGIITIDEFQTVVNYDFGYYDDPLFIDFSSPIDGTDQIGANMVVGFNPFETFDCCAVVQGSLSFAVTIISVEIETITLEIKNIFNYTEAVYKSVKVAEQGDPSFFSSTWENVYTGKMRLIGNRPRGFTQTITINRNSRYRVSSVKIYEDGEIDTEDDYPNNVVYYDISFNSLGERRGGKYYREFLQGKMGTSASSVRSDLIPSPGSSSISKSESQEVENQELPYVAVDENGGSVRRYFSIPVNNIVRSYTYTFIPFEHYSPCDLKGRVETETVCENYDGSFLVQRTSDGWIYQQLSKEKNTRFFYSSDYTGENSVILTENTTNTLNLRYAGKNIILDNSQFLILRSVSINSIDTENNSLTFTIFISMNRNLLIGVSDLNFALNSRYLFNPFLNNKFVLIKGNVSTIDITQDGQFIFNCSILSFDSNVKTSFFEKFILDEASFFNYLFRHTYSNEILSEEEINNTILNPFLHNVTNEFTFRQTSKIYKNDNIVGNKIYSFVEAIKKVAYIEEWEILDDGKIKFIKVFKTPYYPLNKNSIPQSNSYHP